MRKETNRTPGQVSRSLGPNGAPLLKLQDATVVKNGTRVLDGLTLEIREGEHTAIIGPNGAGKSSLIRLITRQDYPLAHEDGTPPLLIFGQSLWNVSELRGHLGIISGDLQFSFLTMTMPGRTRGLDAVLSGFFGSFGLFPHQKVTPEMQERAIKALVLMEASQLVEKFIEEMSTGEARRIIIARALVHDPQALMLDEPTVGLDLPTRQRFLRTLQGLAQHGKTIILVTHSIEEIFLEINRVTLLQSGRVLRDGPKDEVLTSENLSAMFEAPIKVRQINGYYTASSDG
jgi:iron complex transport system ATP-binding protein